MKAPTSRAVAQERVIALGFKDLNDYLFHVGTKAMTQVARELGVTPDTASAWYGEWLRSYELERRDDCH